MELHQKAQARTRDDKLGINHEEGIGRGSKPKSSSCLYLKSEKEKSRAFFSDPGTEASPKNERSGDLLGAEQTGLSHFLESPTTGEGTYENPKHLS